MNLQENEEEFINDEELETTVEDTEENNFDDTGDFSTGEEDNFYNDEGFLTTDDLSGNSDDIDNFEPQQKTPPDFRVMRFEDFVSSRSEG